MNASLDVPQAKVSAGLFDVQVHLPKDLTLAELMRRGIDAGIQKEKLERLVNALRAMPTAKIGAGVIRERAEQARTKYEAVGLRVEITPVLALQGDIVIETITCPACKQQVKLTADRQCPECGVFPDKFTQEYLEELKKRELERAIRARILEELTSEFEAKLKKRWVFSGKAGALRAVALVVLLVTAAGIGRLSMNGWHVGDALRLAGNRGGNPQALLAAAFPDPASAPAPGDAVAPEADDPLITRVSQSRKPALFDQAVHGSRMTARSAATTPPAAEPVPADVSVAMRLDAARAVAEMGQVSRAHAMVAAATRGVAATEAMAPRVQAAMLEVRAWSLGQLAPAAAAALAHALLGEAQAIPDGSARVQALARMAVAVSSQPGMPLDAARAFLSAGAQALPAIADVGEMTAATRLWTVSAGEVLRNQAVLAVRQGRRARARDLAAQLREVSRQTADTAARAQLLAMEHRIASMLGGNTASGAAITAAVEAVQRSGSAMERARLLRAVARHSGSADNDILRSQVEAQLAAASDTVGPDNAMALVSLALLHAEWGSLTKSLDAAQAARDVPGLHPDESVRMHAELLVHSELAYARRFQKSGQDMEAESVLQRLAEYLY